MHWSWSRNPYDLGRSRNFQEVQCCASLANVYCCVLLSYWQFCSLLSRCLDRIGSPAWFGWCRTWQRSLALREISGTSGWSSLGGPSGMAALSPWCRRLSPGSWVQAIRFVWFVFRGLTCTPEQDAGAYMQRKKTLWWFRGNRCTDKGIASGSEFCTILRWRFRKWRRNNPDTRNFTAFPAAFAVLTRCLWCPLIQLKPHQPNKIMIDSRAGLPQDSILLSSDCWMCVYIYIYIYTYNL